MGIQRSEFEEYDETEQFEDDEDIEELADSLDEDEAWLGPDITGAGPSGPASGSILDNQWLSAWHDSVVISKIPLLGAQKDMKKHILLIK